jgi:hypothetical protein
MKVVDHSGVGTNSINRKGIEKNLKQIIMINIQDLIKYLLEGAAVAFVAYYLTGRNTNVNEIMVIAITAAAVYAVLDMFIPTAAAGARQGAGFGIGYNLVTEGFEDDTSSEEEEENPKQQVEESEADSDTESESDNETAPVGNDPVSEPFASII